MTSEEEDDDKYVDAAMKLVLECLRVNGVKPVHGINAMIAIVAGQFRHKRHRDLFIDMVAGFLKETQVPVE